MFDGHATFQLTVLHCQLVGTMDGMDAHLLTYLSPVHTIKPQTKCDGPVDFIPTHCRQWC